MFYTLDIQYLQIYIRCAVFFMDCVAAKTLSLLFMCVYDVKFWYELGSIELELELKLILKLTFLKLT